MSLVRKQLAPVRDLIDWASLPKSQQLVVSVTQHIHKVDIRGHTYTYSSTKDSAQAQLGDTIIMSHQRYPQHQMLPHDYSTPPASDKLANDGGQLSVQSSMNEDSVHDPPSEYRDRDHDWFQPGRLFKIYAPHDVEIHEKAFVLLDTKNKEGPGLLIRTYDEEEDTSKGYFLRTHIHVKDYVPTDQRRRVLRQQTVYMDEFEDQPVPPGMWIELEHTYNIPFAKYRCVDHGMLARESLKDLRRSYRDWLTYHWGLD